MLTLTDRRATDHPTAGPRAVRETIAPGVLRLSDGTFRVDERAGPRLGPLLATLPQPRRPISAEAAACAHRFDRAHAELAVDPDDAFDLARDALVELDSLAPRRLGHGACPRVLGVDFDGVARLIRQGEASLALTLAVASLRRLGARRGRSVALTLPRRARSPLDGWFTMDPDAVAAAATVLRSRDAPPPIERPLTFDEISHAPKSGGLHCEALFGTLWANRAASEATPDTQHLRDARFARIDLPIGVLHPARLPVVAERLGIAEGALDGALHGAPVRVDGRPLAHLLIDDSDTLADCLLYRVPVVPPGDRPRLLIPGPTGCTAVDHPIDDTLRRLHHRAERVQRMVRMRAPAMMLYAEAEALQALVFEYHAQMTPGGVLTPEPIICAPGPAPSAACALLWLDDTRLLVQIGASMIVVDAVTGQALQALDGDARLPRFVRGGRLACSSDATLDPRAEATAGSGLGVRRLSDGAWLDHWPADIPCAFARGDRLVTPTLGATIALAEGGVQPRIHAWARDGRAVWLGDTGERGNVLWLDDATAPDREAILRRTPVLASRWSEHVLQLDGTVRAAGGDETAGRGPGAFSVGFALRMLQRNGVFSNNGGGRWHLDFDWYAAGFAPRADRLAVMTVDGEVLVIDVAGPRIIQRIVPLDR